MTVFLSFQFSVDHSSIDHVYNRVIEFSDDIICLTILDSKLFVVFHSTCGTEISVYGKAREKLQSIPVRYRLIDVEADSGCDCPHAISIEEIVANPSTNELFVAFSFYGNNSDSLCYFRIVRLPLIHGAHDAALNICSKRPDLRHFDFSCMSLNALSGHLLAVSRPGSNLQYLLLTFGCSDLEERHRLDVSHLGDIHQAVESHSGTIICKPPRKQCDCRPARGNRPGRKDDAYFPGSRPFESTGLCRFNYWT